jgi:Leucine-rich repeat (LRR) protein
VGERPATVTLILADSGLTRISPDIARLQAPRTLDPGHHQLTAVPAELGELRGLSAFLYLQDNRLSTLPATPGRPMEQWPQAIAGMQALIELRGEENRFEALPESIGALHALRELHLRNNRLRALPEAIGELRSLRQLDLRGNPLEALPEALLALPRLEKVDLRWVETLRDWTVVHALEERGCLVYY